KVVVSDISLGKLVVIPDDLKRIYNIEPHQFSVATAIRMSAGYPFFFMPKQIKNNDKHTSYMIDGGILSNFPLWIFIKSNNDLRPVLGVFLREDLEHAESFSNKNGLDMLHSLFMTMQSVHDTR